MFHDFRAHNGIMYNIIKKERYNIIILKKTPWVMIRRP